MPIPVHYGDNMRILYIDIDSLRPDHLGCYGYHRNTSPNIDNLAAEGVRFTNCYATDVPCLPSRTALFSSQFGIHNGVVNHGGVQADIFPEGRDRGFKSSYSQNAWMTQVRKAGYHTVCISPFAERHSAWHFNIGFNEIYNTGMSGQETAEVVGPVVTDWIDRNGAGDNWFMHLNFWDPHTPYRTPESYGNPFEEEPVDGWMTEEIRAAHYDSFGPHSAQEPWGYFPHPNPGRFPRVPTDISTMEDYKQWIDGYDVGVKYVDDHIGQVVAALEKQGVLDDTAIIVSADHGENLGELNVYGDHQTADYATGRIPLIIRWPGKDKGTVVDGLCYNVDLASTVTELCNQACPDTWDGESFAHVLDGGDWEGRETVVVSQGAWACQRGVRFGPWMLIRTWHDGLKNFPPVLLFNIEEDPHETNDLAAAHPDIVNQGIAHLEKWQSDCIASSRTGIDPMGIVLKEGGPLHTRSDLEPYCERLRETGRSHHADRLMVTHGKSA